MDVRFCELILFGRKVGIPEEKPRTARQGNDIAACVYNLLDKTRNLVSCHHIRCSPRLARCLPDKYGASPSRRCAVWSTVGWEPSPSRDAQMFRRVSFSTAPDIFFDPAMDTTTLFWVRSSASHTSDHSANWWYIIAAKTARQKTSDRGRALSPADYRRWWSMPTARSIFDRIRIQKGSHPERQQSNMIVWCQS